MRVHLIHTLEASNTRALEEVREVRTGGAIVTGIRGAFVHVRLTVCAWQETSGVLHTTVHMQHQSFNLEGGVFDEPF